MKIRHLTILFVLFLTAPLLEARGPTELTELHTRVLKAIQNENRTRVNDITQKIIAKLKDTDRRTVYKFLKKDNGGEYVSDVAESLVDLKEGTLAKRYLQSFVESGNRFVIVIHIDSFRKTVKKVYGEQPEELYKIARLCKRKHYREKLLGEPELHRILANRITQDRAEREDYLLLARIIRDKWYRLLRNPNSEQLRSYRSWLTKATKNIENEIDLIERKGDIHYLLEEYEHAKKSYRTWIERDQATKNEDSERNTITFHMNGARRGKNEEWIYARDPVFFKLAMTYKQMGNVEKGKRIINEHLGNDLSHNDQLLAATAMYKLGEIERALSILRELFVQQRSGRNRNRLSLYKLPRVAFKLIQYLQNEERHYEAVMVAEMTLNTLKRMEKKGFIDRRMEKLNSYRKESKRKIDREKMRNELLSDDFPKLSAAKKKRLRGLINQLGAKSFNQRESAFKKLKNAGTSAVPLLRKKMNHPNPEIQHRINRLIGTLARKRLRDTLKTKYSSN